MLGQAGKPVPRGRAEERAAFERVRRGADPAERNALALRYLPLAFSLAARYRHTLEPSEDLRQVASLALLKAIERYDPARGTAFSSFAVPTILGELRRYFRDATWVVRVPRGLQDLANQIDQVTGALQAELRRAPTPAELAQRLGTCEERVLEAREVAASHRPSSLDEPLLEADDGSQVTRADLIGADDRALERVEDDITVRRLIRTLGEHDREILRLRFQDDLTQSEIGRRVGVSQIHVSRVIRRSLEALERRATLASAADPLLSKGHSAL